MTVLHWYVLVGLPLILIGGAVGGLYWVTRLAERDSKRAG